MPKIGGPGRTLLFGVLMFAAVRVGTACLPFLPDGNAMAFFTAVLFLITGCIYSFTEVGALVYTLKAAPEGKKSVAMAALLAARMAGAIFGVRAKPPQPSAISSPNA